MKRLLILILFFTAASCDRKSATKVSAEKTSRSFQYAEGFRVTYEGKNKLVEVLTPFQGATSGYQYLLVPEGEPIPEHDAGVRIIRTPVSSIVCTSTSHIPLLDYLHESDKLVGFPTTDYISSEMIRKRVDEGKVVDLGVDKGMNLEQLAVLKPALVMGYTVSSDYGQFKKMEELGIPVVINAEYLEKHPLGRAEWIKFMALFFNKEAEADSVFKIIEENYNKAKALAAGVTDQPSILNGIVYGDAWFMPGGQNYSSKLLRDAGCHYLWDNDSTSGFLELSFESVFEKAHDADLWIGVGSFKTLAELKAADQRYANFKPFQQQQIYTYDALKGAKGGSVFMELGYLRPDLILNDLVKIGHPELLPEYELYFHKRLPER